MFSDSHPPHALIHRIGITLPRRLGRLHFLFLEKSTQFGHGLPHMPKQAQGYILSSIRQNITNRKWYYLSLFNPHTWFEYENIITGQIHNFLIQKWLYICLIKGKNTKNAKYLRLSPSKLSYLIISLYLCSKL